MKLKTALELLGDDCLHRRHEGVTMSNEQLELVARRAREEAYEMLMEGVQKIRDDMDDYVDAKEALRRVRTAIRLAPREYTS